MQVGAGLTVRGWVLSQGLDPVCGSTGADLYTSLRVTRVPQESSPGLGPSVHTVWGGCGMEVGEQTFWNEGAQGNRGDSGQGMKTKGGLVASMVMDKTLGFSVSSAPSVLSKSLPGSGGVGRKSYGEGTASAGSQG